MDGVVQIHNNDYDLTFYQILNDCCFTRLEKKEEKTCNQIRGKNVEEYNKNIKL